MDRLLALGRRCGLHLQCHASASGEATAAVVGTVVSVWLARWQAADPGLHYSVADETSEEEAFLTRWVGCVFCVFWQRRGPSSPDGRLVFTFDVREV